ncbi:MAG TPA: hypothetical protein VNH40_02030 [Gaiellaceae bacterium]|nr:hypothetical protein [Gaiellaceae bacterium]
MRPLRLPKILLALATGLAAAGVGAPSASACGSNGYSYAGLAAPARAFGISATVTPLTGFEVVTGHVAGWVGVGGPGLGPNGTDEWLQVGFSGFPGISGNDVYYELALPGRSATYHQLATGLPSGKPARVAVLEMKRRPNFWRIWLNDRPASQPIYMPGSHGRWAPIATAESWDGSTGDGACNSFLYRFQEVSIAQAPGGGWQKLVDGQPITGSTTRLQRTGAIGSFLAAQGPAALRVLASLGSA